MDLSMTFAQANIKFLTFILPKGDTKAIVFKFCNNDENDSFLAYPHMEEILNSNSCEIFTAPVTSRSEVNKRTKNH